MSGEVVLFDGEDGQVGRLLSAAAALFAQPGFGPAALVGGLAVTVRLASVHRATVDVDTVTDGDRSRIVALSYVGDGEAAEAERIEINGVHVDVMATSALPDDPSELPDDDHARLFILGHRWALESAEPITVGTASTTRRASKTTALTVATTEALVACKLHAIADRRGSSAAKRESDALDLVRLVGEMVRAPVQLPLFASAPFDLAALVKAEVQRWFIDNTLRTARLANAAGITGGRIESADVAALGALLVNRIASSDA